MQSNKIHKVFQRVSFIQHLCQLDMFRTSSVHHQERFVQAVFADLVCGKTRTTRHVQPLRSCRKFFIQIYVHCTTSIKSCTPCNTQYLSYTAVKQFVEDVDRYLAFDLTLVTAGLLELVTQNCVVSWCVDNRNTATVLMFGLAV